MSASLNGTVRDHPVSEFTFDALKHMKPYSDGIKLTWHPGLRSRFIYVCLSPSSSENVTDPLFFTKL